MSGDISISFGTSCTSSQVPTCLCPTCRTNLGTAAKMRECSKPQQRESQVFAGEGRDVPRLTGLMPIDSQTNCTAGHATVLTLTNFSCYSADICSRDKNPSGHSEELFVHSTLPSERGAARLLASIQIPTLLRMREVNLP